MVDGSIRRGRLRPLGLSWVAARRREPSSLREAADVAELAEDGGGNQLADPVLAEQRLATALTAGEAAQLALERRQLGIEGIDHRQPDPDALARCPRQLEPLQESAPLAPEQALGHLAGGDAVVEERRPDPLQPLCPLLDQRPAQAGA